MAASQKSIWFILFTILLDAIGLGLLIPVLPDVLRRFISDSSVVSEYYGYFIGPYAVMQFFASPVLGSLSDRFGRKVILLISLFGAGIDYVFMAYAPTLPLLFVGRIISGLTGASATVASSYIADISDDQTRPKNFGMIGAAWGIGFIAGPMLGGLLASQGSTAPFLGAAALNIINFLFGLFALPETLPKSMRRNVDVKRLNPFTSIIKVLKPSPYVMLVWIYFLLFLGGSVHPVNWTLYTQTKFGWTAGQVGASLSFVGLMIATVQGGLTQKIVPKLGEERSLTVGILFYVLGFLFFALAPAGWVMYPVIVVFAFSGIAMPAIQSILGRHVPPNEQGELQGSLVSLGSVSQILAPAIFTPLFVTFTKPGGPAYFPGAAYIGATVICAFTLALRFLVKPGSRSQDDQAKGATGAA